MLIQPINRADSERVYVTVQNVEGATITTGLPVAYTSTVNSIDGANAVIANSADVYMQFVGVAIRDIPNNGYGLIQTAGYVNSVLISTQAGTSSTIQVGEALVPSPSGFTSLNPTYLNSGFRWVVMTSQLGATQMSNATGTYVPGIIRGI